MEELYKIISENYNHGEECGWAAKEYKCRCGRDKSIQEDVDRIKALIIRVTDSIIGKDEDSNYSSAPGVGGFDIEKVARNNLRTEQRIKRDELVKK